MNLSNNQGVTVEGRTPLKVVKCTEEKRGCSNQHLALRRGDNKVDK